MERSTFKAKALRSTWFMQPKSRSPVLMLSHEENGCRLYNPKEDQVYETKGKFPGYRFLGSSGKWCLVIDSLANLHIVDVFSDEKFSLPPLESMKGEFFEIERVGDNKFKDNLIRHRLTSKYLTDEDVRGHLWVDEKNGNYVVVWHFVRSDDYLGVCKKGDHHYREIPTVENVPILLHNHRDVVLKGYCLYLLSKRHYIRILDLSGQDGFKNVTVNIRFGKPNPGMNMAEIEKWKGYKLSCQDNIAVTTSGDILLVHKRIYESTTDRHRIFDLFKRDPKDLSPKTFYADPLKVDSLGDEALFLELGITVPANPTLGIEPNSIYFTRDDRVYPRTKDGSRLDICVYNLATKTTKSFPFLSTKSFPFLSMFKIRDVQWFLPS